MSKLGATQVRTRALGITKAKNFRMYDKAKEVLDKICGMVMNFKTIWCGCRESGRVYTKILEDIFHLFFQDSFDI